MGDNQANQTPTSDHIEAALDMMRQGARMILSDIPDDSSMASLCLSGDVSKAMHDAFRPEAAQVRVRDLEWYDRSDRSGWCSVYHAGFKGERYLYEISCSHSTGQRNWSLYNTFTNKYSSHPSLEAAKAAAQADYKKRIRAALEPDTVTGWQDMNDEARKAGLVLVVTDEETFHTAYWSLYNGGTWFIAGTQCSIRPRKWRPLPTAPEKEG